MLLIPANDPSLQSWVAVPDGSDFPIQNLPFGLFCHPESGLPRACTAIGDQLADLAALQELGWFEALSLPEGIFKRTSLNDFIALGKPITNAVRQRLSELFRSDYANDAMRRQVNQYLYPIGDAQLLLPIAIGDYTDFYSSKEHATNVGMMFRDPKNALLPNWLHLPVGYHGRASSIVLSGTPITRPKGQTMPEGAATPVFGLSQRLDFELEMAFVVGRENRLGEPIPIAETEDYIFGMLLFNDWSARDIQQWEYVPLGPFLGKNFGSTISPWIVTLEALEPFRVAAPLQDPPVLPYLQTAGAKGYDIQLSVEIQPEGSAPVTVSRSNFKYMYWSMCQQLAHHTVNGCNMRIGDLCASGTISGPSPDSYGSMLEITWKGTRPIAMADGSERRFIQDGDTVLMRGWCEKDGVRIGFGVAEGKVVVSC